MVPDTVPQAVAERQERPIPTDVAGVIEMHEMYTNIQNKGSERQSGRRIAAGIDGSSRVLRAVPESEVLPPATP